MKKAISLILAFVLCLSLCACGKSEAVKNVETLISSIGEVSAESGEAIAAAEAAYNALTDEEKAQVSGIDILSSAKVAYVEVLIASVGDVTTESGPAILAAEDAYHALSDEEKAAVKNYQALCDAQTSLDELRFLQSFLGKWIELRSGLTLVFNEDGTGMFEEGLESIPITYEVIDETVRVSIYGLQLDFYLVVDADGITHFQNVEFDCVRESDLEAMEPTAIEITAENWNTYFEVREIVALIKNAFGEYIDVEITHGIFLKDEYLDDLSERIGLYPSAVTFEMEYDFVYKYIEFDKATGEYSLSDKNYYPEFSGRKTTIVTAYDLRTFSSAPAAAPSTEGIAEYVQNDPSENLVAKIYDISRASGAGMDAVGYGMNFEVLRVTGTIYLDN